MTDHSYSPSNHTAADGVAAGSPWRLRYWLIYCGQASSLIGSALTQFVLLWWITDTTNDLSALAVAGMVGLLPQALLGPIGGAIADRYNRRAIMIGADAISALCMVVLIVLFLTNSVQLWHIYSMMFIRSAMQAFQQPAAAASTAMLVPKSFLPRAAGLDQTLLGIMVVAAAPLGALAISLMPIGYALAIDVVTALLGITPLLFYRIPQQRTPRDERPAIWFELKQGFVMVWSNVGLRNLFMLMAIATMLVMPSFTLVPLLVKEHFGGGVNQVAIMEGFAGAGMVLGGVLAAIFVPKRKVIWIVWGFSISCFTLALAGFAPSNMLWLATGWWVLSALAYVLGNAPLTALLQATVPNHMQGRALSLLSTIKVLGAPLGIALATPLGELIGVRWLFVCLGVLGGIVSLACLLSRAVRNIES